MQLVTAASPEGCVSAPELDNGEVLTEGPAIVRYLADQKSATGLVPPNGSSPAANACSGTSSRWPTPISWS